MIKARGHVNCHGMGMKIYKIVTRRQWRSAVEGGIFRGAPVDLADGFIHFSTAAQLAETARRHFSGMDDLLVLAVDADSLGDDLRWEISRGGDSFPHLYSDLAVEYVEYAAELPLGPDGGHVLPAEIG